MAEATKFPLFVHFGTAYMADRPCDCCRQKMRSRPGFLMWTVFLSWHREGICWWCRFTVRVKIITKVRRYDSPPLSRTLTVPGMWQWGSLRENITYEAYLHSFVRSYHVRVKIIMIHRPWDVPGAYPETYPGRTSGVKIIRDFDWSRWQEKRGSLSNNDTKVSNTKVTNKSGKVRINRW